MTNNLANGNQAAEMVYGLLQSHPGPNQPWSTVSSGSPCIGVSHQRQLTPGSNPTIDSSSYIGLDTTGIAYFSIAMQVTCYIGAEALACVYGACVPTPTFVAVLEWAQPTTQVVSISSAGVATPTAPYNGHAPFSNSGYLVVGCLLGYTDISGNNYWYAIGAGLATSGSLAAAITACNLSPVNQSQLNCDDVAVTINS